MWKWLCVYIHLVLMITNYSNERSFFKLTIIKNRLRTSVLNERLNNLALFSVESDILRELDFEDLIDDFGSRKARKVSLSEIA